MDEKTVNDLAKQIADLISSKFVFPEAGDEFASRLQERVAEDSSYRNLSPVEFAEKLTKELDLIAHDTHLRLDYDPHQATGGGDTKQLMRRHFEEARRNNFGFLKAERLAGNIGYLKIQEFPPTDVAMDIAMGAMAFVANTRGLIFDICGHKGGSPKMVQLLVSYLVSEEPHPLTGIYFRATGQTELFQTLTEVPGRRMPDVPVYVLVDSQTHSAAEAFAYDLQALKRGTIIGERTRGGAHLVDFVPINDMFVLMIPVARAVNPITDGNWQGTGVIPDFEISAEEALRTAHLHVLNELIVSTKDSGEKIFLQNEMKLLD